MNKALKASVPRDLSDYDIESPAAVRKSFGQRAKTYRNSGTVVRVIGPRTHGHPDVRKIRGRSAREVGDGTEVSRKLHRVEKRGGWPIPARPFIGPAADQAMPRALAVFSRELPGRIEKEAQKQAAKARARR